MFIVLSSSLSHYPSNFFTEGGLLEPKMGNFDFFTLSKFLSEIFISISAAKQVVPHLQRVFQADACHINFGKYTLCTCLESPTSPRQAL